MARSTTTTAFHTRPPARTRNVELKIAILKSGKPQRAIAREADISESRLSDIVIERASPATAHERRALARVLHTSIRSLFPIEKSSAA